MEKEFIPYEQALALKELGFDEPCFGYYIGGDWDHDEYDMTLQFEIDLSKGNYLLDDKKCTAPTFSQAFRWFREKYRLDSKPEYFLNDWYCFIINDMKGTETSRRLFTEFPSYEEAELECLKKLIEKINRNN